MEQGEVMVYRRLFVAFAVVLSLGASAHARSVRAYHIGNSLTDNIYPGGLGKLAQQKGDTYTYGKHVSPGVPLDMTWNYKSKTGQMYSKSPYGLYKSALKNYTWDVLTLQPFDNKIEGSTGDLQMAKNFINFAKGKSPNVQAYIYQRWPRQNGSNWDYTKAYTKAYTGQSSRYDLANERQGYFGKLLQKVREALPSLNKKVLLVPLGDVLLELDKRIKEGRVNGVSNIKQLYADNLHLNQKGGYVASMTFYATMFKKSPVGTSVPGAFGSINSTTAAQLQDAVWDVVSVHPDAGVNLSRAPLTGSVVPEPAAVGLLALTAMLGMRRRGN
jgi:hypothetical protein